MIQINKEKHPKLIRLPEVIRKLDLAGHGFMSL